MLRYHIETHFGYCTKQKLSTTAYAAEMHFNMAPLGTRTPTNGFGDRYAAITPARHLVAMDNFEMSAYRLSSDCSSSELHGKNLARVLGLEPRMTESKSVVLPLHYSRTETGLPTWIRTKTTRPQTADATR